MIVHSKSEEDANEVEISYSPQALLNKAQTYGLSQNQLCNKLSLDLNALASTKTSEFTAPLAQALKAWQPSQNIETFTAQINQLIFLWLNAMQNSASTQDLLKLLQCFKLKSTFGSSATEKLHLFLFDLLAETAQQYQQATLSYVLNFDANTQLPNANQILQDLSAEIRQSSDSQLIGMFSLHFQAARNKLSFSKLVALDLNKQIASILKQNLSVDCRLYFSGDSQFDILIPNLSGAVQLNLLAAKINRAFEDMLSLNFQSILVTPYIGCASTDSNSRTVMEVYNNAKLALENAIATQKSLVIYTEELEDELLEQNNLEAKVLEAFGNDNLTLFLQPIVDIKSHKCIGAELLLRWSEKYGFHVYPSLTIEILNKVGKSKIFTRWLINSACRYASELQQEHGLNIYLTLNLRAEDLYDAELPHLLMQAISLWKISSKDIILEITENGILEYNESSTSVINQLAENGFQFALDDFGTGFSSLSRLRTMPIDLIKIDQSFVRNITQSRDDLEIVQSIALLAKSLGKQVLAEGVEDEDCLNCIKELNIDKCQGYFFAKPMSFEHFIAWNKAR